MISRIFKQASAIQAKGLCLCPKGLFKCQNQRPQFMNNLTFMFSSKSEQGSSKISKKQKYEESDDEVEVTMGPSNNYDIQENNLLKGNLGFDNGYIAKRSYDSLENLVDFGDETNNEGMKNTQRLFEKIMSGEVEFNEGDSIDKLVKIEDVFKGREQKISFQLMNIENAEEILRFYESEVERIDSRNGQEDPLSLDEIALFFYFATFQKKFISDNKTFSKILKTILSAVNQLSATSLQQFVWQFGSYVYDFGEIKISEPAKKNLADAILSKCQNFEQSQNVSFSFALSQIFNEENDYPLVTPIISVLATNSAQCIEILSHDEVITMIMIFMATRFEDSTIVSKFVNRVIEIKEVVNLYQNLFLMSFFYQKELSEDQIQKAACALGELNYGNTRQFTQLAQEVIDRDKGNAQFVMNIETACSLIFTLSGAQEKREDQLRSLLRVVHSKYKDMNITNYVNLWLALARFRVDPKQYEQTFSILQNVFISGHVFTLEDLNNDEIVRVIVAASALKLDNKTLIGEIFKTAQLKIKRFTPEQLVLLARSSIIYVKQFESFFIVIHQQCLTKLDKLTFDQKAILRQTFSRTRILFPDSPLISTTL